MVTAMILINTERRQVAAVAEALVEIDGVSEVYSVSGNYDLVAIIRVASNDDLAELVTGKMVTVDGITHTETMLAFKVFSRHDLESMFAIGM